MATDAVVEFGVEAVAQIVAELDQFSHLLDGQSPAFPHQLGETGGVLGCGNALGHVNFA